MGLWTATPTRCWQQVFFITASTRYVRPKSTWRNIVSKCGCSTLIFKHIYVRYLAQQDKLVRRWAGTGSHAGSSQQRRVNGRMDESRGVEANRSDQRGALLVSLPQKALA